MLIAFHNAGKVALALADPLIVDQTLGNLLEEAAGRVVIDLIIEHALGGVAEEKLLLRAGDGHVAQTALFLHALFVLQASAGGKYAFLQSGNEYDGEFQPLSAVHGH